MKLFTTLRKAAGLRYKNADKVLSESVCNHITTAKMLLRACFLTLLLAQCTLAKPLLLRSWYSQFGAIVETSITDNCTLEVEQYWSGNRTTPHCLRYHSHNCLIGPAVNCIIGTMTETNKANMASAAIVLGLLPTILALAGSTTTETGILSLRRPLLAILLAAGSPSVNPIRTFEYHNPFEMLKSGNGSVHLDHSKSKCATYIIILQYILAGGAAINTFYISRQLSLRTICSFAEETTYLPILWAALAIAIHICGAVAVSWCMRFVDTPKLSTWMGWRSLTDDEFCLSAGRAEKELQLLPGSWKFFLMSWCVSTGTVLHILLGTLDRLQSTVVPQL